MRPDGVLGCSCWGDLVGSATCLRWQTGQAGVEKYWVGKVLPGGKGRTCKLLFWRWELLEQHMTLSWRTAPTRRASPHPTRKHTIPKEGEKGISFQRGSQGNGFSHHVCAFPWHKVSAGWGGRAQGWCLGQARAGGTAATVSALRASSASPNF